MTAESFITDNRLDINAVFEKYRDRPAIIRHGETPETDTFGDVARQLAALRRRFNVLGVSPGSRVALYMENNPLHFLLFFLAWTGDYVFVPMNVRIPFEAAMKESRPDVVVKAGGPPVSFTPNPKANGQALFLTADSLLCDMRAEAGGRPIFADPDLARECSLVHTSGSSGRPMGVVHTIGNHVYSAAGAISFFGLTPEDRWLVSLPLNHVGGLSIFTRTFLSGGAAVFPESRQNMDQAVAARAAGFISVVPTQLIRLMASAQAADALSSMRAILMGGAPSPEWLIDKALDLSLPIVPSYGLTESCSLVTAVPKGSDRGDYKTAGKLLPHRALALDKEGRIRLGGKTRFAYYVAGKRKIFPFESGWFTTSDLGRTDEAGNWIIRGRADEIFISGGENINPFEIEAYLTAIEGIDAAVVVPAPHPEFGMVPWAFVASSGKIDEARLQALLKKDLPVFKIPKRIIAMGRNAAMGPNGTGAGIKADRAYFKQVAARMAGGKL